MSEASAMDLLARWDSFYVIVGSAAGALIGLQFVVMTLIAARPPLRAAEAGAAFATPTIVHFSSVLLLAALLRAPWDGIVLAMAVCGAVGAAGTIYALVTAARMRRQEAYAPDLEDWVFHCILPLIAYAAVAVSALYGLPHLRPALFGVGGATLLLLFCGIHNAWDATAYHVLVQRREQGRDS
jgi:hypothetical protein